MALPKQFYPLKMTGTHLNPGAYTWFARNIVWLLAQTFTIEVQDTEQGTLSLIFNWI
jgi:hypothetical protein